MPRALVDVSVLLRRSVVYHFKVVMPGDVSINIISNKYHQSFRAGSWPWEGDCGDAGLQGARGV